MKHVPHSTFATSIQKIHTMKADISITKSRKGTEIVVSGKRINKYGIIAAIVFAVPMLILFQSIHGETTSHLSLVRFFMCILAAVLVNLFLHKLLFRLFSPIRMWQYRTTCLLPFLLLGILPLIYGMTSGNYDVTRFGISLNPQLHSRSATYIKRNGLLIRKTAIKSSHPFQYAYHPLTP